MIKQIISMVIAVSVVVSLGCCSQKDARVELMHLSDLHAINDHVVSVKRVDCGKSIGFKADLKADRYREIAAIILKEKNSSWERGGITYGKVDVGWSMNNDLLYFRRELDSGSEVIAVSEKRLQLWYIKNPN